MYAQEAPKQEAPDAMQAFRAAMSMEDLDKRIGALERVVRESAGTNVAGMASRELVNALMRKDPKSAGERLDALSLSLQGWDRPDIYRYYASSLLNAGNFPELAVKYAKEAVALAGAVPGEQSPERRAGYMETLGVAFKAAGDRQNAQAFLVQALRMNPYLADAPMALAEILEAQNQNEAALGFRARSLLARSTPERRKDFEERYARLKGSTEGLEHYLDELFEAMHAPLIKVEPYQPSERRTKRTVLAEVYTGAGCGPCVASSVALDALLKRYKPEDVVALSYHVHVPRPDPIANADTMARWQWQQGIGAPTYVVDGRAAPIGGGGRSLAAKVDEAWRARIDEALETQPRASLALQAANDGRRVRVKVRAADVQSPGPDTVLQLVLVEKHVHYAGENGIRLHPVAVRRMVSFPVARASLDREHVFDLAEVNAALKRHLDQIEKHDEKHNPDGAFRFAQRRDTVDAGLLAVVAFVQNAKTREVMQTAWADAPLERR